MAARLSQVASTAHSRRQIKRAQIDELLALAEFLPRGERLLIEQVLGQGTPVSTLARLYQRPTRQLQRQVVSVVKRMSNKLFKFVALQMHTLPAESRTVARNVVLHGLSLRQTARKTGYSLHHVRNHMNTVHATARLLA